jgi:uncharacterized protein YecE (DUF72 family)
MLPLFEDPPLFDRPRLVSRLSELTRERIFIGTSSWKYPGWFDQIYSRDRYSTRGRFSKKRFEAECISEYAETFPTVCGDFAFYQFPQPEFWANLFSRVPSHFQFSFKVPEQITRMEFPRLPRYGSQSGQLNPFFLNAELLKSEFISLLEPHRQKVAMMIFEFGAFSPSLVQKPEQFLAALDSFLEAIPRVFRMAVEIRNPELLTPDYFEVLRRHNVAHVYNAWARMPDLLDQISLPDSMTADFAVCRALLRRGRSYEEAVKTFEPYRELREPYPPARQGIKELLALAQARRRPTYIYINNRLEGNAPNTIEAVIS